MKSTGARGVANQSRDAVVEFASVGKVGDKATEINSLGARAADSLVKLPAVARNDSFGEVGEAPTANLDRLGIGAANGGLGCTRTHYQRPRQ